MNKAPEWIILSLRYHIAEHSICTYGSAMPEYLCLISAQALRYARIIRHSLQIFDPLCSGSLCRVCVRRPEKLDLTLLVRGPEFPPLD